MTDEPQPRGRQFPGELLLQPAMVAAVAVLLLNDHFLKQLWPGAITGKLSDVAGLVVFPLLLCALIESARKVLGAPSWKLSPGGVATCFLVTGVVFAIVKSSPSSAELYSQALGVLQWPVRAAPDLLRGSSAPDVVPIRVLADPTDLLALPALLVAWHLAQRGGARIMEVRNPGQDSPAAV